MRSLGQPEEPFYVGAHMTAESEASPCSLSKIDVKNAKRATIWGCCGVGGASLSRECLHTVGRVQPTSDFTST